MPALMRTPTAGGEIFRASGFVDHRSPDRRRNIREERPRVRARQWSAIREAFLGALRAAGLSHLYSDIMVALLEERAHAKPVRLDVTPRAVRYLWTARRASWRQIVQAVKAIAGDRPSEAVVGDWP